MESRCRRLQWSRLMSISAARKSYNAPRQAIIDLALGGPQREQPSEHSTLVATMRPLLGNLSAIDLKEDTQFRDLTFLSGETGIDKARVALWSVAAHVANNTKLPPELFYALFRRNVPADAETIALASSTQGTDLVANAQHLQEAILSTTPSVLQKAIDSAIADNVIPASYAGKAKEDLAQLGTLADIAALNSVHGMGKTSIASVMNVLAVTTDIQHTFIQLYANVSTAGLRTFWSDLSKNPAFTSVQVADMHFGVTVGRLTRGHLPLITELASMRSAGKIKHVRDLARLTAADWAALLQTPMNGKPIGIPANITAATPELAVQTYATMLERDFTLAYPTVAFSARLASDKQSPFAAKQAVTTFLNANPQYVNAHAYTKLGQAVFPWTLPFDLPLSEARTYLGQLRLDRVQLARTFQKSAGYPSAQARFLAVEALGLSAMEADIITAGTLAAGNHSWDYWGLAQNGNNIVDPYDPTKTIAGTWIDVLAQARVLLSRANLTYQELTHLLNTFFMNHDGTVTIVCDPPDSCDIATMTTSGLTQDKLDRMHRFVRLWRRLRWNIYDLDLAACRVGRTGQTERPVAQAARRGRDRQQTLQHTCAPGSDVFPDHACVRDDPGARHSHLARRERPELALP